MQRGPQDWIEVLAESRAKGVPCALVVVTGIEGSTPREVGARMVVADGRLAFGTIGGGNVEHLAIRRATELLESGEARSETMRVPLAEKAGQCCGGRVTLFIEAFPWTRRRLVVFGAGHVAQAIGGLAGYLGVDVALVDSRSEEELQPPLPANRPFTVEFVDAPEEEVDAIAADSLVLVMTHDHALDQEIVARAITRGTFPYVGLIGSERKWERFRRRLARRGFTDAQLDRVRCPIGVTKGSKEPRAIAISVAAELLEVLSRASAPAIRPAGG